MININYDLKTINDKRNIIKVKLFETSRIKSDNFTNISNYDLNILFKLYDEIFLESWFHHNFKGKIKFTLSRQLTRSAGNTRTKKNIAISKPEDIEFEIKISLNHLTDFDKVDRYKYVGGIVVKNKLDSLMLIFEHELCHVIEFLIYKKSSCRKKPFKNLIYGLFGQTESTHKLVSATEINIQKYGYKPGDKVDFEYEGKVLRGIITRINKRATVMSLDINGNYVDSLGNHYMKYYIPLNYLSKKAEF
ncbi:hypothetical protein [Sedimentibacter sp. MB31-C6]|uniref:hypothetical protein n=1 Tax=Sedimentibacter sp. MB31-C6 TaxID=3109366 RepID=UPI002DDD13D5|nr:hypothetical protein [Sedimentibacter sp. MB36-C1]WSI04827.1 hypothetical protein U8307_03305 [Sedimentibacter sp. MB36-C1]